VFYYTGGLDLVPHIPDVCLVAGGLKVLGTDVVTFRIHSDNPAWNGDVDFRRTRSVNPRTGARSVVYYTFSVNGVPEDSRDMIRWKLATALRMRYYYFAKIEFGPVRPVANIKEADRAAQEFIQAAMPAILEILPTEQDVQRLYAEK
jgi:hypothetical protein